MDFRTAGPAGPASRAGIPLGRVLGFPVRLRWSVLVLVAVVTLVAGQVFGYVFGFTFVVLLLLSVLMHELGHALTARRLGIPVRGITLEIFGGYTEMVGDTPSPRAELMVSLAGPAVSLALGVSAVAAALVVPAGPAQQLVMLLAMANLVVAIFNILPGLPLDGGRALRAVVWSVGGDRHRATLVAARWGQGIAIASVVGAVMLYLTPVITEVGLIVLILVAFTIWQGATGAARAARVSQQVPTLDVDQLARPVVTVPTGTPLAEAQRRAGLGQGSGTPAIAVVDSHGQVVAVVVERAAEAVPEHRRPWVSVDSVARERAALREIPAGLRGTEALGALQSDPAAEYLVTRHDQVVGVLRAVDVARQLRRAPDRHRRNE